MTKYVKTVKKHHRYNKSFDDTLLESESTYVQKVEQMEL